MTAALIDKVSQKQSEHSKQWQLTEYLREQIGDQVSKLSPSKSVRGRQNSTPFVPKPCTQMHLSTMERPVYISNATSNRVYGLPESIQTTLHSLLDSLDFECWVLEKCRPKSALDHLQQSPSSMLSGIWSLVSCVRVSWAQKKPVAHTLRGWMGRNSSMYRPAQWLYGLDKLTVWKKERFTRTRRHNTVEYLVVRDLGMIRRQSDFDVDEKIASSGFQNVITFIVCRWILVYIRAGYSGCYVFIHRYVLPVRTSSTWFVVPYCFHPCCRLDTRIPAPDNLRVTEYIITNIKARLRFDNFVGGVNLSQSSGICQPKQPLSCSIRCVKSS